MTSRGDVREYVLIFSSSIALVPAWMLGVIEVGVGITLRALFVLFALFVGLKIFAFLGVYELEKRSMKYGFLISGFTTIVLFQFLGDSVRGLSKMDLFLALSFVPLVVLIIMRKIVFDCSECE